MAQGTERSPQLHDVHAKVVESLGQHFPYIMLSTNMTQKSQLQPLKPLLMLLVFLFHCGREPWLWWVVVAVEIITGGKVAGEEDGLLNL